MKVKPRNFPHPVLNPVNNDFTDSYFNAAIVEKKELDEHFEFDIEVNLENEELERLINLETVSFNVHLECSSTMKRLIFSSYNHTFKITINKKDLNKQVEVNFFIISDKQINQYKNSNFHDDYANVSFKIQRGDILAFSSSQTLYIEKENVSNANSIFKVSKATIKNPSSFYIELNEQIEVYLPKKSYDNIANLLVNNDDCNKILANMIFFPALIETLLILNPESNTDEAESENYSEKNWYRTIEAALLKKDLNILSLRKSDITHVAYDLINDSVDAPFVALHNIFENTSLEDGEN